MRIAVLIPCFNEETTIAKVTDDFRNALPQAVIYVYDNNSTDRTAECASAAGAIVRHHPVQGKGHVVRRMFADIEADVYVLVDGDDTYDAVAAPELVTLMLDDKLDFVNAARLSNDELAYRRGHRFGNAAFTSLVRLIFGQAFSDILSGYKVLSRRFVKTFPAMSGGFEIETELAVHALELDVPRAERPVPYKERPAGSVSKLRTFRDGFHILMLISRLVKDERPLQFFGLIGLFSAIIGVALGVPIIKTYLDTGLVPRFPTAFLAVGLVIIAVVSIFTGIILDVVTKTRREVKRLAYLSLPSAEGHQ
ncbi:glycosyltransferase family 2 protein [Methyloceanibacter sp.]|uniref:glycosyltransferase family 2 protein n=1 Tax=Methyloceanibacter sp. TaxID=1965321 RepID=UPI003D6D73DA